MAKTVANLGERPVQTAHFLTDGGWISGRLEDQPSFALAVAGWGRSMLYAAEIGMGERTGRLALQLQHVFNGLDAIVSCAGAILEPV